MHGVLTLVASTESANDIRSLAKQGRTTTIISVATEVRLACFVDSGVESLASSYAIEAPTISSVMAVSRVAGDVSLHVTYVTT